jgi:hypothetical protein
MLPVFDKRKASDGELKALSELETLVGRMLELHRKQSLAKAPQEQTVLARQIIATDREIDRLVYDLYGLTEEEIAIVEGGK